MELCVEEGEITIRMMLEEMKDRLTKNIKRFEKELDALNKNTKLRAAELEKELNDLRMEYLRNLIATPREELFEP